MTKRKVRVIFDTNVWISFLIGKRMSGLEKYISDRSITIITTEQLLIEIKTVASRKKLKNYFPKDSVEELLKLLESIAENIKIEPTNFLSRDPKDNFLLDLIEASRSDYLVRRQGLIRT